jgi:hypothetical protein
MESRKLWDTYVWYYLYTRLEIDINVTICFMPAAEINRDA